MILHQRTHPNLDVADCFGCRAASVAVAASATPTRSAGTARAAQVNATEKQWARDMDAYARLRRDGLQPVQIDGCARVEKQAEHRVQIEGVA